MTRDTDRMHESEFQDWAVRQRPVTRRRARPLGYRAAILWMIHNDDTTFVEDPEYAISVTAAIVADIYDRTNEEVIADLRRAKAREKA